MGILDTAMAEFGIRIGKIYIYILNFEHML